MGLPAAFESTPAFAASSVSPSPRSSAGPDKTQWRSWTPLRPIAEAQTQELPPRAVQTQRSASCPVRGSSGVVAGERFVCSPTGVAFENEAFRRQNEAKIAHLMDTARAPESSRANALLAQKALKYRKLSTSPRARESVTSC